MLLPLGKKKFEILIASPKEPPGLSLKSKIRFFIPFSFNFKNAFLTSEEAF